MAKIMLTPIDPSGNSLAGASVTFYVQGTGRVLADMFTDVHLTAPAPNPSTVPASGSLELYAAAFSFLSLVISKAGYGTRQIDNVEVIGTTPIGG